MLALGLGAVWLAGGLSDPRELFRLKLEFSAPRSLGREERKTMKAARFSDAQKVNRAGFPGGHLV